jgi:CHASE3 domain sensor protein
MDRLKWPHIPVPNWAGVLIICFFFGWNLFVGYSVYQLREFAEHQLLTMQTRIMQEQTFSDLKDAESGQRGYLLTGDERYLAQYISGSRSVRGDVRTLKEYLGDSSKLVAIFDQVSPLIDKKLNELESSVLAYKKSGLPAAIAIVKTNQGLGLMTQIRDMFETMRARQRNEMRHQNAGIF